MTDTTVSLDVLESLDVAGNDTLEVTLYVVVAVDLVAQFLEFSLSKVLDSGRRVDASALADVCSELRTDTVDVSQADLNLFVGRNGYVSNTRHKLPLPLFVFGLLFVDDNEAAFAAHKLVIRTDFFDTGSNLHSVFSQMVKN